MVGAQRARIVLDIEVGTDPIEGSLACEHAAPVEFTGWIELTQALNAALGARRRESDPPPAARS